jgi:hypothetical protein
MNQLLTRTYTNQTTSWLMCSWSTFGARTNHKHTQAHKTHHSLDFGEDTTFSLIVFFMLSHMGCTQMSFCPRTFKSWVSKFLKLGLLQLWGFITFFSNLRLRWVLKQSYNLCWNLSKNMWHGTYIKVNQGNSWLLVFGSQIDTLTPNLSFGHNLCFKYLNGSCEPMK